MNRIDKINFIRKKLRSSKHSIGTWIQIPHSSIAEILGKSGYDWVAVDLEHGSIGIAQLPDLFRAIELGGTLPIVRLAEGRIKDCKQALDAGSGGVIVPMVTSASQLQKIRDGCCWPPSGTRSVGFSRANLFGEKFEEYYEEAQSPLLVAQIESFQGVENLESILKIDGLDAILIGPYDLSASMELTGQFEHPKFVEAMKHILEVCQRSNFPSGIHVVNPDPRELKLRVDEGHVFIAYSIDAVFLNKFSKLPNLF